ncbi:MAG: RNA polymerase sigma factor [Bacteroidota bacterium]
MIHEKTCLKSVAKGDEKALEQLYNIYSVKVYNTALNYTKSAQDAEEILQDVFVIIYNTASKFKFSSSVSTWIYRITVNKSLDFLRKKNSQKRYGIFTSLYKKDSIEIGYESFDFVHPGVKLENKEDATFLYKAIDILSEHQKTAFILIQIEGLPHHEVAKVMGKSSKSVESLLGRAKQNLREELKKYFPERGN